MLTLEIDGETQQVDGTVDWDSQRITFSGSPLWFSSEIWIRSPKGWHEVVLERQEVSRPPATYLGWVNPPQER